MIPLPKLRTFTLGATLLALLLVLGALGARNCIGPARRPPVHVTTADQVNAGRPTAEKPSLVQRIATVGVQPTGRAVAPGAAFSDVAQFCRAAGYSPAAAHPAGASIPAPHPEIPAAESPRGDRAASAPPPSEPPAAGPMLLYVSAGSIDPHRLILWSDRSDGASGVDTFTIRRRASFTRSGDSLVVRGPRFGKLRDGLPVAECAAGMLLSWQLDRQDLVPYPGAAGGLLCLHAAWRAIR